MIIKRIMSYKEQREFTRADYAGLSSFKKLKLKKMRNQIAKELKLKRKADQALSAVESLEMKKIPLEDFGPWHRKLGEVARKRADREQNIKNFLTEGKNKSKKAALEDRLEKFKETSRKNRKKIDKLYKETRDQRMKETHTVFTNL